MKPTLIAFDIDGTLRNNEHTNSVVANERIRTLLITLSSFKNVKIHVWSGGGELYARQMVKQMGIGKYVDSYSDKMIIGCKEAGCANPDESHWHFSESGVKPDIAIDDIQSFSLGKINLIVREK